ncbi:MAG: hypothetical protein ABI823_16415 [Bryobacteraceae bacterium]
MKPSRRFGLALLAICPLLAADAPSDLARDLPRIRRVYVDRFTGGESAAQLRELIISSLQATKLFILTENEQKADAILRGGAEDLIFTDQFQTSDNINARLTAGTGVGSTSKASRSESDRSRYAGVTIGEHESSNIKERKHEAFATVRLVNKDGDVIWSTTQESQGGKFRSASADVADKIAKQLTQDAKK